MINEEDLFQYRVAKESDQISTTELDAAAVILSQSLTIPISAVFVRDLVRDLKLERTRSKNFILALRQRMSNTDPEPFFETIEELLVEFEANRD